MAAGWVKSLQCKSKAFDDIIHNHHHHLIPTTSSCRKSVQSLKNVVEATNKKERPRKPKQTQTPRSPSTKRSASRRPEYFPNPPTSMGRQSSSMRHSRASSETIFPALTELPEGHPSRNVVEIIFHTSWSPKEFSGQIEMVFKVQNLPRTVTGFEEYREIVKSRASAGGGHDLIGSWCEDHSRCVADGNEVMRFYCLGPSHGGSYDTGGGAWVQGAGKGATVSTFSGSGAAHEDAGGGTGRRAMLVCRVVAGRVYKKTRIHSLSRGGQVGCDSVSGDKGELLVFDSHAVLPCFLLIYNL